MDRDDIHVLADLDRPGGWLVESGGLAQSYVDVDDPRHLEFDYVRAFAAVLDTVAPGPLRVLHVGGGACTFARYVEAVRPGSRQQVVEPDAELTRRVLARLPLPAGADIRVEALDGRTALAAAAGASADVVVVDAWTDGRVPADLTTVEALADVTQVLATDGALLLNVADGPGNAYLRRVVATVAAAGLEPVVVATRARAAGRGHGNAVVAAARHGLAAALRPVVAVLAPGQVVTDVAAGDPLTDADPQASPPAPADRFLAR